MKKLKPIILDLQGLVYNAYHSGMTPEPLVGNVKEKVNTGEYGFEMFLGKFFDPLLDIYESPIHMIAVVDDGNTYRKSLFPEYKSERAEKRDKQDEVEKREMRKAMDLAKEFLASLGVPIVRLKGQEADDVIAYLTSKLHGHKIVATIDKDLLALAGPYCHVFRNGVLETEFNDKGVIVPPGLVSLYLSIVGDSADSFPGLKGEGPKAWEKMVEAFGIDGMEQLRDLIDADERVKIKSIAAVANNKTLTKLADSYSEWRVQYEMAKLHPELCEGAKVGLEWYKRVPTIERLTKALTKAGMDDVVPKYEKFTYKQTLVTKENLNDVFKEISKLTPETLAVAWDYETYDDVKNPNYIKAANGKNYVDVLNSKIAGCSFALGSNLNHVYYFSVAHKDTDNVDKEVVLSVIKHFEEEGVEMVAQNIGFEATVSKAQLGHTPLYWGDTKIYAHHLDENNPTGLKELSKRYLNYDQVTYAQTLANANASDMSEISGEQVLSYGCDDSIVTGHLYQYFTLLTQLEGTYDFITEYECPAVEPLTQSYIDGVMLDPEELEKQKVADEKTVTEKLTIIRDLLREYCKEPNFAGVDTLFEDQKAYIQAKAQESGKDVNAALAEFKQKLKENCRYIEPYETRNPQDFTPTPGCLTKIAGYFGLPPIEKVSKKYLSDYLSDNDFSEDAKEFAKLLAPAVAQFSKRSGVQYEDLQEFCESILYKMAPPIMQGTELNFGSPAQMQHLLYLLLGLPIRVRTKVQKKSLRHEKGLPGSPAADAAAIDFALANDCSGSNGWKSDLLKALKTYAAASTRLSIYWGPWPLWMGEDNIMHPNFINPGTVTRRPTGSSPNLLQVSKGAVRKCIIPRSDENVIVSVDFASQELRVMAAITGDENFLSAYIGEKDKDLHAMTACGVVPSVLRLYDGINPSEIEMDGDLVSYDWFKKHQDDDSKLGKMLKDVRGTSKTINFGAGYGATSSTVSQQAMIPLEIAELAVDGFYKSYPGVLKWKSSVYDFAKKWGFVATTYGSRRHCGNALVSGNRSEISRWERQLCNYLIQGQCADLLKVVLANASRTGLFKKHGAMLIAPIYDELLVEVPRSSLYGFLHDLADLMEIKMPGIIVPMVADCSFGANWGVQEEVGARPSLETINTALSKIDAAKAAKVGETYEESNNDSSDFAGIYEDSNSE